MRGHSNKPLLLARMNQSKRFALVPGLAAQQNCETLESRPDVENHEHDPPTAQMEKSRS